MLAEKGAKNKTIELARRRSLECRSTGSRRREKERADNERKKNGDIELDYTTADSEMLTILSAK